jgi:serine/threonine protein kinase
MKKYSIQNTIGSGNFSTVFKGFVVSDHSPCAIKVMRAHH